MDDAPRLLLNPGNKLKLLANKQANLDPQLAAVCAYWFRGLRLTKPFIRRKIWICGWYRCHYTFSDSLGSHLSHAQYAFALWTLQLCISPFKICRYQALPSIQYAFSIFTYQCFESYFYTRLTQHAVYFSKEWKSKYVSTTAFSVVLMLELSLFERGFIFMMRLLFKWKNALVEA